VVIICFAFLLFFSFPLYSQTEEQSVKSKAIHIVYDDSGSMIKDEIPEGSRNYVYSDRWAQNKYAMEVFAAMLDEQDTMNVYYMSDFDVITENPEYQKGNVNAPAGVEINGYDLKNGVKKIHDMITVARNTPYDAVKKAYNELIIKNADVKWLIVLSDGYFNQDKGVKVPEGSVKINDYFDKYSVEGKVKIVFLAMGEVADKIDVKENKENDIYFKQAKNNDEILERITEICNIIFNRSPYPFPIDDNQELEFDLPTEILVFAQGPSVEVYDLKGANTYNPRYSINVRYTDKEKASININYLKDPNVYTAGDLTGVVAKFQNIPKGKYSLDIKGAKKVDVYIKPDVNLLVKMFVGRKENRVTVNKKDRKKFFDDVEEGRYRFQYGIVDDKGKYFEPEILNEITYDIKEVENNGEITQINSGDSVKLTQGEYSVHVKVRYLNNNFKEEIITGKVLPPRTILERLRDWVKRYKKQLITIWGLFMIWFLYGRKPRFPREMKKKQYKPDIVMERNGKKYDKQNGKFILDKMTILLPLCAEKGVINFIPIECTNPISGFQVKAAKEKGKMIIMNTSVYKPGKISGVNIKVGGVKIDKETENELELDFGDTILTTIQAGNGYPEIKYTCTLQKNK